MGNKHSDLNSANTAMMWNQQYTSAFHNYCRSRYPDQQKVKPPMLQRLNSVGEDIDQNHNLFQSFPKSVGSKMSKMMFDLRDNAFTFKTAFGLQSSQAHLSLPSRSSPISVSATTNEKLSLAESSRKSARLLKSHSLPEVFCSRFTSCPGTMHFKFNDKPDRSWSFGSYGDERTLYDERPHSQSMCFFGFTQSPQTISGSNAGIDSSFSAQESQASSKSVNANILERIKEGRESDALLSHHSIDASVSPSPVECEEFKYESPLGDEIETDCAAQDMQRDGAFTHLDELPSKCPSAHPCSTKMVSQESIPDLASVLFSPRKAKKGRPSSKKQKKRKRQRQKHASNVSPSVNSKTLCGSPEKAECDESVYNSESDLSNSVISLPGHGDISLSKNSSTPIKPTSPHPIVHCLFSSATSSESEDSESDQDDDSDWSVKDESEACCVSPINGLGFSISLNLDSVFKQQHVPTLESLLSTDCSDESDALSPSKGNNLYLSGSISLSDVEDMEDSIEFCTSIHVPAQGNFIPLTQSNIQEGAPGHHEDSDSMLEDLDVDYAEINAKWNEMYSSPEACCCCKKRNHAVMANSLLAKVILLNKLMHIFICNWVLLLKF